MDLLSHWVRLACEAVEIILCDLEIWSKNSPLFLYLYLAKSWSHKNIIIICYLYVALWHRDLSHHHLKGLIFVRSREALQWRQGLQYRGATDRLGLVEYKDQDSIGSLCCKNAP